MTKNQYGIPKYGVPKLGKEYMPPKTGLKQTTKDPFGIPKFETGYTPQKYGKYGFGSSDHLAAAGNIAHSRLQSQLAVPHQEDVDADFYGKLDKKLGDQPSLASGILLGLESNARGKANKKRQDITDKYEKFMGYIQEVNTDAMLRIDEQKKDEALKARYLPEVLTYIRSAPKLDPQSQLATIQSVFKRYGQESGTNIEAIGVDSTDPNIVTLAVPGSPESGTVRVDLRDFFADNQQVQQEIALLGPQYQAMLQEKREQTQIENMRAARETEIREQNAGRKQEEFELERQYAPIKYQATEDKTNQTRRRNDLLEESLRERGAKRVESLQGKYGPKIEAAGRIQVVTNKIEHLIKNNPGVANSYLGPIWENHEKDPGFINTLMRKATDGKTAQAISELGKYLKELKIDLIKGLPNPNKAVDLITAGIIPGMGFPEKSILKIMGDLRAQAQYSMNLNRDILNEAKSIYKEENTKGDFYADRVQKYIDDVNPNDQPVTTVIQEEVLPPESTSNSDSQAYQVKVQRPDGKIFLMSPKTAEEAKKHGGKIIQ